MGLSALSSWRGDARFSHMGKRHPLIPPALLGGAVASSCPPAALRAQAGVCLCLQILLFTQY